MPAIIHNYQVCAKTIAAPDFFGSDAGQTLDLIDRGFGRLETTRSSGRRLRGALARIGDF
jgi:hypothetical protein